MYIKSLIIFSLLIFLSACGASASPVNTNATMSWIHSPPSDTKYNFYAVGYGKTQKDAKSDALSTISSKISVEVASNFSSSVTATRHNDDEDLLESTKNEVVSKSKNIEYTDVKVQESYNDGNRWIVLVEIDREILTKTYERKLKKVDLKIKTEWGIYKESGLFEKLKISLKINSYLKETDSFFPLLHAINRNYDDSAYISRYTEYTKEMRKAKSELVFKITSDKRSEPLASLIRDELSAQNATFNNKRYNVEIKISTKAKMRKVRSTNKEFANLTIALRKTVIKAIDRDGNIVSNTVYKTKEGSSIDFEDAIAKTAKYEKMINTKGIIAFIAGNDE